MNIEKFKNMKLGIISYGNKKSCSSLILEDILNNSSKIYINEINKHTKIIDKYTNAGDMYELLNNR